MSKHGSTKQVIVDLISKGTNNLSEICKELDLRPSTVSKHIHDLEDSGVIVQKENPHIKKWKYYAVVGKEDSRDGAQIGIYENLVKNRYKVILPVFVLIFVLGSFVFFYTKSVSNIYIPVSMTDPPQVPVGTQSLYINYSSVSVQTYNDGAQQWISINTSGRINLMSIINTSQIIAELGIKPGSSINAARFNITSASITINNVTFPVMLSDRQAYATLNIKNKVNLSSGVLLDFYPVVIPYYENNTTRFVMLPSLSAMVGRNPLFEGNRAPQGYKAHEPDYRIMYMRFPSTDRLVFYSENVPISANATMYERGNVTQLDMMLHNYGVENLTVYDVILRGDTKEPFVADTGNSVEIVKNTTGVYRQDSSNITINASAFYLNAGAGRAGFHMIIIKPDTPVNEIRIYGVDSIGYQFIQNQTFYTNFEVYENGTLLGKVPINIDPSSDGFALGSGKTANLSYTGYLKLFGVQNNNTYTALVMTNRGVINIRVNQK
jgi:hypothetical protein